jgi:hypothetical protein
MAEAHESEVIHGSAGKFLEIVMGRLGHDICVHTKIVSLTSECSELDENSQS